MERINVGIIGTGWCGGIRAETCADSPFVNELHIAETNADRLAEMERLTKPKSSTSDYRRLLDNKDIDAIIISATPETTHYPMARAALLAGKHVFLEKPIAQTLEEADELTDIARRNRLKFTVGYSQRFNAKYAYVREKILDGTLGEPVSAVVSRHLSRALGKKIASRTRLSPAAMEATHDLDFILWCLEPRKPIRVYAQTVEKVMQKLGDQRRRLRVDHRHDGRRRLASRSAPAGSCRPATRISPRPGSSSSARKARSSSTTRIATWC